MDRAETGDLDCYYLVRARNYESAKAAAIKDCTTIQGREIINAIELDEMGISQEDIPTEEGGVYLLSAGT